MSEPDYSTVLHIGLMWSGAFWGVILGSVIGAVVGLFVRRCRSFAVKGMLLAELVCSIIWPFFYYAVFPSTPT